MPKIKIIEYLYECHEHGDYEDTYSMNCQEGITNWEEVDDATLDYLYRNIEHISRHMGKYVKIMVMNAPYQKTVPTTIDNIKAEIEKTKERKKKEESEARRKEKEREDLRKKKELEKKKRKLEKLQKELGVN